MEPNLKIGYIDSWNNEGPVILFSGKKTAIQKLARVFQDLSMRKISTIRIDQLDFIEPTNGTKLEACVVKDAPKFLKMFGFTYSKGIKKKEGRSFIWVLESWEWDNISGLLSAFDNDKPGHQYLQDYGKGEIGVIVSCGEYTDSWWCGR